MSAREHLEAPVARTSGDGSLRWLKLAVFISALVPFAVLLHAALTDSLGANPVEEVTHATGTWTLVFLCITLAVTPLRRLTGWTRLLRVRRMIGLFAFFYALLHLTTYVWFDQWFDLHDMIKDIAKRPFITIGFAAFVLLIPLAVTSTDGMVRRLGRRWKKLHRLIYLIAPLGVLHYFWLVKKDLTQPLAYGAVVLVLLVVRLWWRAPKATDSRRKSFRSV